MGISTRFAAPRREPPTPPHLWYGDFVGAYLELRERGISDIRRAVEALAEDETPTATAFDVIADGLFLYRVELEDGVEAR
jgi:hypothetical protein